MDDVQRASYRLRFRVAFLELKGKEFEGWFARLAEFALPDFERVRPYGREGDRKADGRTRSDRTIYQCYAPETLSAKRLIAKLDADFSGAVANWPDMGRWVFVHNDIRGLAATVLAHLDRLRAQRPSVVIEVWGEARLTALADRMDRAGWESLFGVVPSGSDVELLVPEDVAEVISFLAQAEPTLEREPLTVPSVDKIKKNELSEAVQTLLDAGKRKDQLVKDYFASHPRPDLGENIAAAFRGRYAELKSSEKPPDDIFLGLQSAIGERGSPRRQVAALTLLSYLFDRCDIFEDPDTA